ncbi:hypothetical protein OIU76_023189, partial [Salix suchowensis]
MWDLTHDLELLRELPEEYTFETALADLIDISLQAVWSNGGNGRKRISGFFIYVPHFVFGYAVDLTHHGPTTNSGKNTCFRGFVVKEIVLE